MTNETMKVVRRAARAEAEKWATNLPAADAIAEAAIAAYERTRWEAAGAAIFGRAPDHDKTATRPAATVEEVPGKAGWRVNLICCGREAGHELFATWAQADAFRESYVAPGPAVNQPDGGGHWRCAIIVADRPQSQSEIPNAALRAALDTIGGVDPPLVDMRAVLTAALPYLRAALRWEVRREVLEECIAVACKVIHSYEVSEDGPPMNEGELDGAESVWAALCALRVEAPTQPADVAPPLYVAGGPPTKPECLRCGLPPSAHRLGRCAP